jgi:hypothetical protein
MFRIAKILMVSALLAFMAQGQSNVNDFEWYTKLKQVTAPGTGIMYGVDHQDRIFGWNGKEWQPIAGSLSQISAGSINDVWGVNSLHYVWRLNGDKRWENVPGAMRMVAVAKGGGEVVGLDLNGKPSIWNGSGGWLLMPNAPVLEHIDVGRRGKIYGNTSDGTIYAWRANQGVWKKLRGNMRKIRVAADGTIGGVNDQKEGYLRTEADIEAELAGATKPAAYTPVDFHVTDVIPVDHRSSMLIEEQEGLLVQRTNNDPIILDGQLVVSTISHEKPYGELSFLPETGISPGITVGGCVMLQGTLKLNIPGQSSPQPVAMKCVKGNFKNVVKYESTPQVSGGRLLTILNAAISKYEGEGTAYQYVARPLDNKLPKVCDATSFRVSSHRSWAEFRLPAGFQAQFLFVPAEAHANYVPPACHRVRWDNLSFFCNKDSGGWKLIGGAMGADGFCHGVVPVSPYLAYGDK